MVFDPVNYLTTENYMQQDEIFKSSFELFGKRIQAIHLKDFTIENGIIKSIPLGKGLVNYSLRAKLIKQHRPYVNMLMEDVTYENAETDINFIKSLFAG